MSDIRLRLLASVKYGAVHGDERERTVCASQMSEAAGEIERLRAELAAMREREARLRGALEQIAGEPIGHAEATHREVLDVCVQIARAALDAGKG